MDKNTVTGFVLIALVLIGFTWFQSNSYNKQVQEQLKIQAYQDSLHRVDSIAQAKADSIYFAEHPEVAERLASALDSTVKASSSEIYRDTLLGAAHDASEEVIILENDKLELQITTRGAQPLAARVKDYRNYDSTDLYLFKRGASDLNINVYAGQNLNTRDFTFQVAQKTDRSVTLRLPFEGGGYIQQVYTLSEDSYMVDNVLSFVGMDHIIPRNVSTLDMEWNVSVPRMEKGYKNEAQYSKVDYYLDGEKKPFEFGRGRSNSKRIDSRVSWFAFQQQFFSSIMRSKDEFESAELSVEFAPEDNAEGILMNCRSAMRQDFRLSSNVEYENEFYFGPNQYNELRSYSQKYEKIIPLGGWLVGWFTRFVIIPLFHFFHGFVGNFGLVILLMTLVIKIVVMPLTNKQFISSGTMAALKPEIEKINARYPKQEDAMKKQQATMDLYRRVGVSPMGGCLPMLLTFPILWAMFRFFPASIELRQQSFLWCDDLSSYDAFINFGTHIPLIGDHVSLFALLMAVTTFFYSKITMANSTPASNDPTAQSMQFMSLWMMPLMMFFICNSVSAALSYYYFLSQIFGIVQNFIIKKYFINTDEIYAKLKATEGKKAPKSKWQLRLEEAQKMQEQARKNARK